MKILITGGAGFIGSHLADALLAAGHGVILFDNLHPQVHPGGSPPPYLPAEAELIVGDVRDRSLLCQAVQRADAIYHLAALTGVGQSMYRVADYVDVNVRGTAVLLDILANEPHRVRRLILGSSRAVYGEGAYECRACGPVFVAGRDPALLEAGTWDPPCPRCGARLQPQPTSEDWPTRPDSVYAATKVAQEHLMHSIGTAYGIEVVALRYFNVYGPRQSLSNPYTGILSIFLTQLQDGKTIEVYEDGQESRDFVHVSDVVQANLLALECPIVVGETLNVGSGEAASVLDVARLLTERMGNPGAYRVSGRYRMGDIRHCRADIGKARRLLGYQPRVSLKEGMADFVAWALEQRAHNRTDLAERELVDRRLLREVSPCREPQAETESPAP